MTKALVTKEDVFNCMVENSKGNICSLNQSQLAKKLGYMAGNATGFVKILKELQDTNAVKFLRRGKWAIMPRNEQQVEEVMSNIEEKKEILNVIDSNTNDNLINDMFEDIEKISYIAVSKIKNYFELKDTWIYSFIKNNESILEVKLKYNEKTSKDMKYLSLDSAKHIIESIYSKYGNKIDIQKYNILKELIEQRLFAKIVDNDAKVNVDESEENSVQEDIQATVNNAIENIKNNIDNFANDESINVNSLNIENKSNINVSESSMLPNLLNLPKLPNIEIDLNKLINIDDSELINKFKENHTAMLLSYKEIIQQLRQYKAIADTVSNKYQELLNTVNELNLEMEKEVIS